MKCYPPGFTSEEEHECWRSVEGSPVLLPDRPVTPWQVEPVTVPSGLSSAGLSSAGLSSAGLSSAGLSSAGPVCQAHLGCGGPRAMADVTLADADWLRLMSDLV